MKLAALGLIAIALGIAIGEDGLAYAGGLWFVLGSLLWALVTRHKRDPRRSSGDPAVDALQRERDAAPAWRYPVGITLIFAIGLGSLAIGILEIGFEQGSGWRWAPIAVGGLVTLFGVINFVLRVSGVDLDAVAKASEPQQAATVTIEAKQQTGVYVNEQPRIEFDLLVEPEGLPSYRVKKKATVPHSALSDIGIGDGFAARVDPEVPDRIAIDWNAPVDGDRDEDPGARLERLDDLRRRGLIDADEYEAQRRRIVGSL